MTQSAHTVIYGITTPNWNIGPTYEREKDALRKVEEIPQDGVIPVVSWVDDYEQIDRGVLLWRTDGIHESSWVVAEEPTDLADTMNEGVVGTTLVSVAEAESVE
jgi:hypothetical protein